MFREGQHIGPYVLVRKLGKGGFGEVWLAEKRTELVTKKVAVKLPLEEQVNLDAVKKEAALWEEASGHANVLPIIDADIYDGQVVIVSEYATGGSLHDWLKKHNGKSPSIEKAIELMTGILNGLVHLHSHKITHRDLKPNNILLHGETPRITDFGVSRIVEHSSRGTEALGTPIYMSPEAFRKSTSPKTDIWAAGVVFYELLSGDYPFYDDDVFVLMDAIRSDEPKPLSDDIPVDLRWIVGKALLKNPDERFQTAQEMRNALLSFKQSQYDDNQADQSGTLSAQYKRTNSQTPRKQFFETTTLPFKFKKDRSDSVETRDRLTERKRRMSITSVAVSFMMLAGLGGLAFWSLSKDENNPGGGQAAPQLTNVSETKTQPANSATSSTPYGSESVNENTISSATSRDLPSDSPKVQRKRTTIIPGTNPARPVQTKDKKTSVDTKSEAKKKIANILSN